RGVRRAPVRVLHARPGGRLDRAPAAHAQPDARRSEGRARRQPLPLRHLRPRVRGGAESGQGAERQAARAPERAGSDETRDVVAVKAGPAAAPKSLEVHPAPGDLPPWDLDSKLRVATGRHARLDGPLKVTGRAKYTFDLSLPGMLWGKMVRAAVPAGEIVKIDTSRAEALPGVKAVWTTESRKVRFAGQDVAAVAARAPEIAEDAVRLIQVQYDEKPFSVGLQQAMAEGAPLVFEPSELPTPDDPSKAPPRRGNVVGPNVPRRGGSRGDVAQGFAQAEVVGETTYEVPVHTHSPLETHGVIARWEGDQLTIWASTQGIFTVRNGVADALKVDRKNVAVLTEHMGG